MKPIVPVSSRVTPARAVDSCHSPATRRSHSFLEQDPGRDRIMRRREVQRTTGLSRSSLYRLIAAGNFPSSIQLSANAVGWLETEVSAWIEARVAASRSGHSQPASTPVRP